MTLKCEQYIDRMANGLQHERRGVECENHHTTLGPLEMRSIRPTADGVHFVAAVQQ